jgi:hypothetical protein
VAIQTAVLDSSRLPTRSTDRSGRADDTFPVMAMRAGVIFGLFGVALIHLLDVFSKLEETPYLGGLYIALIGASLAVGMRLIWTCNRRLLGMAAAIAGATFIAYVLSRTTGLPKSSGDIGNWEEPLGVASLFVEGLVVILSGWALAVLRPQRSR